MNIYNLTNEQFEELTIYYEDNEITIYRKDEILIIRYHKINNEIFSKIIFFNRFNLDFAFNPKDLFKLNSIIIGYTIEIKKDCYPINELKNLSTYSKIKILLKLKEHLNTLHQCGIFYGNLTPNNIWTNGKDVYLDNIVNCKYDRFDFNSYSQAMTGYKDKGGQMDINLDNYMFNLLTIYFLNDIKYDNVLDTVANIIYDYFNNKEPDNVIGVTDSFKCLNIASQMIRLKSDSNELLIDYIDKEKYKFKIKT